MSNDSFKYSPDAVKPAATNAAHTTTQKPAYPQAPPKSHSTQQPAPKPRVPWSPAASVILTLVIYFFGQLLASIIVILGARLIGGSKTDQSNWLDTSVAAQFYFVLLTESITFGAVWWFIRARGSSLRVIGWRRPRRWTQLFYVLTGFGVYFLGFAMLLAIATHIFPSINIDQKQELGFENPATPVALLLTFISLVVLPPLVEETVFRGFLYTGLRSKMKPILAGIITSALFASAHLQIGSGKPLLWVAAIDTFVLSLVLCYLRQKTDSLWPGILLHALKNGIAFFSLFVITAR